MASKSHSSPTSEEQLSIVAISYIAKYDKVDLFNTAH